MRALTDLSLGMGRLDGIEPLQEDEALSFDRSLIDEYFPFPEFRDGQRDCIEFILDALEDGKKYVIVEAPTGSGKSAIAIAVARFFNSVYYLTIQKFLQSQIINDFGSNGRVVDLKGRATYPCTFYDRFNVKSIPPAELLQIKQDGVDCNNGFCRKKKQKYKIPQCFPANAPDRFGELSSLPDAMKYSACPYYEQLYRALAAQICLMNFSSFLYQSHMSKRLAPRDLMVVDEAHQMEPQLLGFIGITLNDRRLRNYGVRIDEYQTPEEYWIVFRETDIVKKILQLVQDAKMAEDIKAQDEYLSLAKKINSFMHCMEREEEWVSEFEKGKEYNTVRLKPVFAHSKSHPYILNYGRRCLLMSATILDVDVFCGSLGIARSETAAVRMKNRFPVSNRPIHLRSAGSLTGGKKKMGEWGPRLLEKVDEVVAEHPNDRGIIHTHNFAIADLIMRGSKHRSRFLYQVRFPSKERMLEVHGQTPGSVIVAPAMHEGLDLIDDLCYDQETEILTEFGWVLFPDLVHGTRVAAYHPDGGRISFEEPLAISQNRCARWAEFDTMTNNLMVTQPHRMLWRNSQTGDLTQTSAAEAPTGKNWQFITAGHLDGNEFDISDDQLRLAVAFQADGSWLGTTEKAARFSFRRPRKIERFRVLVNKLGYNVVEQTTTRGDIKFLVPKKYLSQLRVFGEWDDSKLWKMEGLLRLSLRQRRVLIDELKHWDGSFTDKGTTYDKMVYHSSIKENIDTIQALAAVSGYRTDYNGHCLTYRDKLFSIFVNGEHNYILKEYDVALPCFCVTVSTGWILIRRRGKVTVSGNSRFQIICKIPWANFYEDKQLARRVELDTRYYVWLTALKLVQSYGRSIRSEEDHAMTYILDGGFDSFVRRAGGMVPSWFRDAVQI